MTDTDRPKQLPGTSGYPEPQPTPKKGTQEMLDEKSPHEPQNDTARKPTQPR